MIKELEDKYARKEAIGLDVAAVYAGLGEKDLALEQLAIISVIPAGASYGDLKLSSDWDSLRGDPRFEAMVAKLAPKETLK